VGHAGSAACVRPVLSQAVLPSVEDELSHGLCPALGLVPAPVPGLLPADEVQHPTECGTPAQVVGRDARSPRPSGSIHQCWLCSAAGGGESAPDAAGACGLRTEQGSLRTAAPRQPAAPSQRRFPRDGPAKGEQRRPRGSAGSFGLWGEKSNVGAELEVKHCCLPLVQITAPLPNTSAGARRAMLLPGLGQPLEASSTVRLNTELHSAPTSQAACDKMARKYP